MGRAPAEAVDGSVCGCVISRGWEHIRPRRSRKPIVVSRLPSPSTAGRLGTCQRLSAAECGAVAPAACPHECMGRNGVSVRQYWSPHDRTSSSFCLAFISLFPVWGACVLTESTLWASRSEPSESKHQKVLVLPSRRGHMACALPPRRHQETFF